MQRTSRFFFLFRISCIWSSKSMYIDFDPLLVFVLKSTSELTSTKTTASGKHLNWPQVLWQCSASYTKMNSVVCSWVGFVSIRRESCWFNVKLPFGSCMDKMYAEQVFLYNAEITQSLDTEYEHMTFFPPHCWGWGMCRDLGSVFKYVGWLQHPLIYQYKIATVLHWLTH